MMRAKVETTALIAMTLPERFRGAAVALVIVLALCPVTDVNAANSRAEIDFVMGNVAFVLLHELAHVVIGDNDVPILGPIESAADYTALVIAIRGGNSEPARAFLSQALTDTAAAFSTSWQLGEDYGVAIPYWGIHRLSIQRYYTALCLIYGSDPDRHRALLTELPEARAAGCATEYLQADRGYQWLLDTYGNVGHDADPVDIAFDYRRVASLQQQRMREELQKLGLIENTVEAVGRRFQFKAPLIVNLRTCGRPEAAWIPERRELLFCYELLDAFVQLYRSQNRGGAR